MKAEQLEPGETYRIAGTSRKVIFTGDPAPTPDGKEQAWWCWEPNKGSCAFTASKLSVIRKRRRRTY